MNNYHCSLEVFHTSSTQQLGVLGGCVKDLWNKHQVTYFSMRFGQSQPVNSSFPSSVSLCTCPAVILLSKLSFCCASVFLVHFIFTLPLWYYDDLSYFMQMSVTRFDEWLVPDNRSFSHHISHFVEK